MLLKRLLKGTDKRGGKDYVKTDCSRGVAVDCTGTLFVPKDSEGVCARCVIQQTGRGNLMERLGR
jgi:hypothetical protein